MEIYIEIVCAIKKQEKREKNLYYSNSSIVEGTLHCPIMRNI